MTLANEPTSPNVIKSGTAVDFVASGTASAARLATKADATIVGPTPIHLGSRFERSAPSKADVLATENTTPINPGLIPSFRTANTMRTTCVMFPNRLAVAVHAAIQRKYGWRR